MKEETLHKVGNVEYKVNHVEKKVYKKQALTKHMPEVEHRANPSGFKWLPTGGDYAEFMGRYGAPVSAEPVIGEFKPNALPAVDDEPASVTDAPKLPTELMSSKKLKAR